MRVRRVVVAAGSVAAVVCLLYLSLYLRWPVERPVAYWTIDDRSLGVLVGDSPNLGCEVPRVDETSEAVTIHAQCWEHVVPVPQMGSLQAYVMEITLQDPLGSRAVQDGTGEAGMRCEVRFPVGNCPIPGN